MVAAAGREIDSAVIVVAVLAHVPVDAVVAFPQRPVRHHLDGLFLFLSSHSGAIYCLFIICSCVIDVLLCIIIVAIVFFFTNYLF